MDISKLIKDINEAVSSPHDLSESTRVELLAASQKLSYALENPFEASLRLLFAVQELSLHQCGLLISSQPTFSTIIRLGVDMKLFDAIAFVDDSGISVEDLATKIGADPLLVCKLRRIGV